jgi:tetratricopeptide (TPR) repeat protein
MSFRNSKLGMAACLLAMTGLGCIVVAHAAGSGGMSGGSMSAPSTRPMTPAEQAKAAYNAGVRYLKHADKYDADSADPTKAEKKREKAQKKAYKQYTTARKYFVTAATKEPTMHEAWNYVGYTSRKLGETDIALKAYNQALRLKPGYNEAIEYRGVAYLHLNRLDDAKADYMTLFRDDRKLADQLLVEMQQWVEAQRQASAGTPNPDVDGFAEWVGERASIAQQTVSFANDAPAASWQ